ncbi:hypothetical protein D9M71_793070 [compost metagenome]
MSLDPIEKPSKWSRNSSASSALDGSSHIMMTSSPFSPRRNPFSASRSMTPRPSARVRTNGIISLTLVSPISLRTKDSASHSRSKQSRKDGSR